jgi:hypothetical protein
MWLNMAIHHNDNSAETSRGVRLEDNRLHLNRISIESATAAGLLRRLPPDEWVGVVGRMVDHGAGALEAAYTSSTLQLVNHQLEAAVVEMQAAMTSAPLTWTKGRFRRRRSHMTRRNSEVFPMPRPASRRVFRPTSAACVTFGGRAEEAAVRSTGGGLGHVASPPRCPEPLHRHES